MVVKINASTSRKVGTANYGSLSASCGVEFEADIGLLAGDPDVFRRHVAQAYAACRMAVEEELAWQQGGAVDDAPAQSLHANGSSHGAHPSGTSSTSNGQANGHSATEKQLLFARHLAKAVPGLDVRRLESLVQKLFHKPLATLSSREASTLIDTLKAVKAGEIELAAVLKDEPT